MNAPFSRKSNAGIVAVAVSGVVGIVGLTVLMWCQVTPELAVPNVGGPPSSIPAGETSRVFWATPDAIIVNRSWKPTGTSLSVIRLSDRAETDLRTSGKHGPDIIGVSPDGQFAIASPRQPSPRPEGSEESAVLISLTDPNAPERTIRETVEIYLGSAWTGDGKLWMVESIARPMSMSAPKPGWRIRAGVVRFPRKTSATASRPLTIEDRDYYLVGTDAAGRIFFVDADATVPPGCKYALSPSALNVDRPFSQLVVDAYATDGRGRAGAPTRLTLPVPPNQGFLAFAMSPDGRRIAYMTKKRLVIPARVAMLWGRLGGRVPRQIEIWVADLDGSRPRRQITFPLRTPDSLSGAWVDCRQFQWSPDGKRLGFLLGDDFYTTPVP